MIPVMLLRGNKRVFHAFLIFGLTALFAGQISCSSGTTKKTAFTLDADPPPLVPGTIFRYEHIGPLPWSDGTTDASGPLTITVLSPNPTQGATFSVVEELYERADGSQLGHYDNRYRLAQQAIAVDDGVLQVQYQPPMPVRYLDIPVGEDKKYTVKQRLAGESNQALGDATIVIDTHRDKDERIITPAGAYLCRRFISIIQIVARQNGSEMHFRATEDAYWCDKIAWFVKRSYTFDPLVQGDEIVRPGYKTECTLVEFTAPY